SKVFRGKFLEGLTRLFADGRLVFPPAMAKVAPLAGADHFARLVAEVRRQGWVVYSKAPFAGPEKLLHYLGHYTHRVAISNSRLICCAERQLVSTCRDRQAGDVQKTRTLPADEFLRRFLCHVLPSGFQRIRHYGLLANRGQQEDLKRCRELLAVSVPEPPAKKSTAPWRLLLWGIDVTPGSQGGAPGPPRTVLVPAARAAPGPRRGRA